MKRIISYLTVTMLVISLAFIGISCKAEPESIIETVTETVVETVEVEKAGEEKISLEIWSHSHAPQCDFIDAKIEQYKSVAPNVTIVLKRFPWREYETALTSSFAGGAGPDLFTNWDKWFANYADKGVISPVDFEALGYDSLDSLKADFAGNTLDFGTIDGVVYGIPNSLNAHFFVINRGHMEEVGLDPEVDYPKSWDDLVDVAKKLVIVDEKGKFIREGFDLQYGSPLTTPVKLSGFMAKTRAKYLNEDRTESVINSPEAVRTFQFLSDLIHVHKVGSPAAGNLSDTFAIQDFFEEQTSMWLADGIWVFNVLKDGDYKIGGIDNIFAFPVPYETEDIKDTFVGGWAYAVSESCENKKEAWKFVDFVFEDPTEWINATGLVTPISPDKWIGTPEWEENKPAYFDIAWDSVEKSNFTMPKTVAWNEIGNSIHKAFENIMYNDADVQQVLDQAKEEMDAALAMLE